MISSSTMRAYPRRTQPLLVSSDIEKEQCFGVRFPIFNLSVSKNKEEALRMMHMRTHR